MSQTLAGTGHRIYSLIEKLSEKDFHLDLDSEEARQLSLIIQEGERFKTWAVSLGLLVYGHGSLDYRVREAGSLASTLNAFLQDLVETLEEVLDFDGTNEECSDMALEGQPSGSLESTNEDDDEPQLASYYEAIHDIVNRLLRLSVKLRNPSTRLRTSKAQTFRQIDNEVDLFEIYESFDLDYVSSMFRYYRHGQTLEDTKNDGGLKDPPLYSDYFLVARIARANTMRRRQFAYWRRHQLKLEHHTDYAIQASRSNGESSRRLDLDARDTAAKPSSDEPLSVTTATLPRSGFTDYQDEGSTLSVSEYVPSPSFVSDNIIFPSPPQLKQLEDFFQCPYCFTTCGKRTAKGGAWMAHLIHDLRPYVCTYETCRTPDQMYDSKADWIQHESSSHKHSPHSLAQENHQPRTEETHTEHISGTANLSLQTLEVDEQRVLCPVCNAWVSLDSDRQNHIAAHLERFALFSLPRTSTLDSDEIDKDSRIANVDADDVQAALSQSLSFDSIASPTTSEVESTIEEDLSKRSGGQKLVGEPTEISVQPGTLDEGNRSVEAFNTLNSLEGPISDSLGQRNTIPQAIVVLQNQMASVRLKNSTMINFYIHPSPTPSAIAAYEPRLNIIQNDIQRLESTSSNNLSLLLDNTDIRMAEHLRDIADQLASAVYTFQELFIDHYDPSLRDSLPYLPIWQTLQQLQAQLKDFIQSRRLSESSFVSAERDQLQPSRGILAFCSCAIALVNNRDRGSVTPRDLVANHGDNIPATWKCQRCAFSLDYEAQRTRMLDLKLTGTILSQSMAPRIEYRPVWLAKCHLYRYDIYSDFAVNDMFATSGLKYGCIICFSLGGNLNDESTCFSTAALFAEHLEGKHSDKNNLPSSLILEAFNIGIRGETVSPSANWDLNIL